MKFNLDVLADRMRDCGPQRHYVGTAELCYGRFELFGEDSAVREGAVLVMKPEDYAGLPVAVCEAQAPCIVCGPVAQPHEGVPTLAFERAMTPRELLARLLDELAWLTAWSDELLGALIGDVSLQGVFDIAARAFANPIMLSDSSMCYVLMAGHLPDGFRDELWTPALETGICPAELYRKAWTDADPNAFERRTVCLVEEAPGGHRYMFRNLIADGRLLANFEFVDANAPFTLGDVALAEYAGGLIERAVARRGYPEIAIEGRDPLQDLLDGKVAREAVLNYGLRQHGWAMDDKYYVTYVTADGEDAAAPEMRRQTRRRFEMSYPLACVLFDGDACVMVARDADYPYAELRAQLIRGERALDGRGDGGNPFVAKGPGVADAPGEPLFRAGVSSVFSGFLQLPVAADQARRAFAQAESRHGGVIGRTVTAFYEDCFGADVADRLGAVDGMAWLLPEPIAQLARMDAREGTSYVETIAAFYDHACNVSKAAAALFVHRNTLAYRIKRIRALTGIDLEEPPDQTFVLRAHLACRMLLERRS